MLTSVYFTFLHIKTQDFYIDIYRKNSTGMVIYFTSNHPTEYTTIAFRYVLTIKQKLH